MVTLDSYTNNTTIAKVWVDQTEHVEFYGFITTESGNLAPSFKYGDKFYEDGEFTQQDALDTFIKNVSMYSNLPINQIAVKKGDKAICEINVTRSRNGKFTNYYPTSRRSYNYNNRQTTVVTTTTTTTTEDSPF